MVLSVFGIQVAGSYRSSGWELRLESWMRQSTPYEQTLFDRFDPHMLGGSIVLLLGDAPIGLATAIMLWWISRRHGLRLLAWWTVLSWVTTEIMVEVISKPWFGRVRGGWFAYPSGHTARVTTLAFCGVMLLIALAPIFKRSKVLAIAGIVAGLAAILEGLAVVVMGWHYPLDAIGGWAIGIAVPATLAALVGQAKIVAPSTAISDSSS